MSLELPESLPPPLPKSGRGNVVGKLGSIFSFAASMLVFWFVLLIIPGLYVLENGDEEGIPRTYWDVLVEERATMFMLANLFYFLLIPIGIIFIVINVVRFPWWTYPLVPVLCVLAFIALAIFS